MEDFFPFESDTQEEAEQQPQAADEADSLDETQRLTYINFIPPDPDGDNFWDEVSAVKVKRGPRFFVTLIILILTIVCLFAYSLALHRGKGWFSNLFKGNSNMSFTLPIAETPTLDNKYQNDDGSYNAAGVAKAALPSVVQIKVYSENVFIPASQGSGIIMSEDGYIITNAHVVSTGKYGITVMLYDKTEYSAKIVGSDDSTDIAVLKIGAEGLTPAQFADSDTCELGDEVVAIGSPAGYENSVTKGIVSGLNRSIRAENSATAMNCIQIDAAINPGNSGGPLFNMFGQVIGITSSKLVSTSYDNIGFAITINSAKPIIEELIENGYIPDKGRVGIYYYAITEETAKMYGIKPGIYVASIDPECNIAETELKEGDIITEFNGVPADSESTVSEVLAGMKAGDDMVCKVYRPKTDEDGAYIEGEGETFEIEFKLNSDKSSMIKAKEKEKGKDTE